MIMKKILILFLLLVPLFTNAQTWYRAIAVDFEDGKGLRDCNIKILLVDDYTIKIFANKTVTLTSYGIHEDYDDKDKGMKYRTFKCIDEDGEKCLVTIAMMEDLTLLRIEYDNFSVHYGIIPDE